MYNNSLSTTITGTGGTSYSITPAEVSDVSAISRQMTPVQKLLAEHREVQSIVHQRLNAVLRPSLPSVNEKNGSPSQRPASSPIVADLEDFTVSLQTLLADYQDILHRLEL